MRKKVIFAGKLSKKAEKTAKNACKIAFFLSKN
jgi:hypothetical protein